MKRSIFLLTVLAGILAASCVVAAGNTFPFPNLKWGLRDGVGVANEPFPLVQGWFTGDLAWYVPVIGLPANSYRFWLRPNLDLDYRFQYPKLTSAIGHGAAPMYVVLNFDQGPVLPSSTTRHSAR